MSRPRWASYAVEVRLPLTKPLVHDQRQLLDPLAVRVQERRVLGLAELVDEGAVDRADGGCTRLPGQKRHLADHLAACQRGDLEVGPIVPAQDDLDLAVGDDEKGRARRSLDREPLQRPKCQRSRRPRECAQLIGGEHPEQRQCAQEVLGVLQRRLLCVQGLDHVEAGSVAVAPLEGRDPLRLLHVRLEQAHLLRNALAPRRIHQRPLLRPRSDRVHRRPVLIARGREEPVLVEHQLRDHLWHAQAGHRVEARPPVPEHQLARRPRQVPELRERD